MVWRTIGRLILVPLAALAAAVVAAFVAVTLGLESITQEIHSKGEVLEFPELVELVLGVAAGSTSKAEIAVFLQGHSR